MDARTITLALAAMLLRGTSPSSATTWHILPDGSGDAPTIAAGINAAAVGDTVLVGCGIYYEFNIIVKDGIVLRSETGQPDCVTIDAQNLGYILACSLMNNPTVIEGLTLTGGFGYQGGGMLCNYASPTITRCVFTGNSATLGGALVCRNDAAPIVSECNFIDNSADQGGAVYLHLNADPTFDSCTFSANAATGSSPAWGDGSGGAVFFWQIGDRGVVRGCTFSDNWCTGPAGGGAVFCDVSSPMFEYCDFQQNSAPDGGAVRLVSQSSATFTDCTFGRNSSNSSGGAIQAWGGCLATIRECQFTLNHAQDQGGAIMLQGDSDGLLEDCAFISNTSSNAGALLFADCSPTLVRSSFSGNTVTIFAGALGLFRSDGVVEECTFVQNFADGGGAINCIQGSPTFTDCLIDSNLSTGGGGGMVCDSTDAVITRCDFLRNQATFGGGMICLNGATDTVTGCTFSENTASLYGGGGADCDSRATPQFIECIFSDNTAAGGGGGMICFNQGSPNVVSCTFVGNAASVGGGLYASGTSSPIVQRTIFAFNTNGGAAACDGTSSVTLSCSDVYGNVGGDWVGCIAGQTGSNGNLSVDPDFCDAPEGNYRLDLSSACRDAPGCGLLGALGAGCRGHLTFEEAPWGGSPDLLTKQGEGSVLGERWTLLDVSPNPARGSVSIRFSTTSARPGMVDILDVTGRRVHSITPLPPSGLVTWRGTNADGQPVSPGVYYVRLGDGQAQEVRRVILLR